MNPLARFGNSTAGLARKLYGTVTGPARHSKPDMGTIVESQFGPGEATLSTRPWMNYAPWLGERNVRTVPMSTRRLMRIDSQVSLGLAALKSPFFGIEYYPEGGRPIVRAFLQKVLLDSHLWHSLLWSVLNSMDFGFQTHEYQWMLANVEVRADEGEEGDEDRPPPVELPESYVIRRMRDLAPERVHLYRDRFGDLCSVFVDNASAVGGGSGMGVELLPEQVLHAVHQGEHDNLRGDSVLDRVHVHWHDKHTNLVDFLHYLKQKGNPSVIGNAPNEWRADKDGNNPIHTLEVMKEALRALKNGSVCVLPSEFDEKGNQLWTIAPLQYQERAEQFLSGMRYHDAMILRGLWVPERVATQDSSVGSNAMAQVHFDTFLLALEVKKEATVLAPVNEVAAALVHYNFGRSESVPRIRGTELAGAQSEILKEAFIKILALPDKDPKGGTYPVRDLTDVNQLFRLLRVPRRKGGKKPAPAAGGAPPSARPGLPAPSSSSPPGSSAPSSDASGGAAAMSRRESPIEIRDLEEPGRATALAAAPAAAPTVVEAHFHMPEQKPAVLEAHLHMPEQKAPEVNLTVNPAKVTVPITVEAPPAADVNLHADFNAELKLEQPAAPAVASGRKIAFVERDSEGRMSAVDIRPKA